MKRQFVIIAAAVAAFFAVSCVKETPVETPNTDAPAEVAMREVTITASIDPETKTSYDAEGKFSWTKGDQISVMDKQYKFHILTATASGTSVTFSGMVPEGTVLRQEAFFPADPGINRTDGSYYFNIPQYKDLTSGSADLPMGAYSGTETYVFKHITGAALLTFTNFPAEVETAEISIVNARLKLTGTFNAYLSSDLWTWNSKSDVAEEERTLIRKVPVVNGQAQIYMPYNGSLWWDYTSTINIIGYDADGNEYQLLVDKTMKADEKSAERGVITRYAPLVLPDYVPEADLTKIDWTDSGVNTYDLPGKASSDRQALRQVKVVADKYYLYARLVASAEKLTSTASDYFGLFLYDKIDGSGDGYYGWNNNAAGDNEYNGEHAGTLNLTDYSVALTVNETTVDVTTVVNGDEVIWTLAIPRTAHTNLAAASVNITFLTYKGWTPTGSVPEKYDPMMVVTLP